MRGECVQLEASSKWDLSLRSDTINGVPIP